VELFKFANSSAVIPRMFCPEERSILPVPANEEQMRVSFKLARNSVVRRGTQTPSGKSVPLAVRLERNDLVRSSTAWISCDENSPSCDITVGQGRNMGLVCRIVGIFGCVSLTSGVHV
jgi:hypothetical protein